MEVVLKNGAGRILQASIQKKTEKPTQKYNRVEVQLLYVNSEGKTVTEWASFWNGNAGQPQLADAILKVPDQEWIIVHLSENKNAAMNFLYGQGILKVADNISVIAGGLHDKSGQTEEGGYNAIVPLVVENSRQWYKISFAKVPEITGEMKNVVCICNNPVPYDKTGKNFCLKGYLIEAMMQTQKAERLSETPIDYSKIIITIGIHAFDKPKLSTLTHDYDRGWLESVVNYYSSQNEDEKKQIVYIKQFLR